MDTIRKYFPKLSEQQLQQFEQLGPLFREWNQKINLISRKDIDNLYERHILHALTITKFIHFQPDARILDIGTGGGFPGIPLAIFFPKTQFKLIDGTRKKITVVQDLIEQLDLSNAQAQQVRAEELKKEKFDFVVSRAVASLDKLLLWSKPLIQDQQQHGTPNGLITLKGGNVDVEIKALSKQEYVEKHPLKEWFDVEYFSEKHLIYVQI
jgi:16S rRNA (guanine527-N7)-methyltransferase